MSKLLKKVVTEHRDIGETMAPIVCRDGFLISVQASRYHYCLDSTGQRPSPIQNRGHQPVLPYIAVECGFPSERPEPWSSWREFADDPDDPTGTVYAYVPVDVVAALIELHGGQLR